ncbi:hypothetical protein HYV50_00610 [Candidatus Pacearchaeota archaeon]|nr:hypothetical protein [Candidatus Pacearchaeota archaeon]
MEKTKIIYFFIMFVVIALFLINFVSASFGDWLRELFGGEPQLAPFNLTVTVGNTPPNITFVIAPGASPVENGTSFVNVIFTAFDQNGAGDLNSSTAQARFQRTGQITRENLTCAEVLGQATTNTKNYSCTIGMLYFDQSGNWIVNATIKDNSNAMAENSSAIFSYGTFIGTFFSPKQMSWDSLSAGAANVPSGNNPMLLNNTGNVNINYTNGNFNITAIDLEIENPGSGEYIYAGNFSVDISAAGCLGTQMANGTSRAIVNAILPPGNNSLNYRNDSSGQEELYFCITALSGTLSPGTYSALKGGSWKLDYL